MESVFCSFVCVSGTCANKKYDSGTCSTLRFPPGEYCRLGVLSFFLNPQKKGYRYNVPTFIYFRLFLCCFFDRLIGLSLVFFFSVFSFILLLFFCVFFLTFISFFRRSPLIYVSRRSCIRRGGSCDHRRNDCCFSSSCRCNLWGSNCRCHRAGLFQKWG